MLIFNEMFHIYHNSVSKKTVFYSTERTKDDIC